MPGFREEDLPTLQPHLEVAPAPADLRKLVSLDLKDGLTILVNDPQRHTDTPAVLAALAGQIDPTKVRVLVATGTHRFTPAVGRAHEAAIRRVLGPVEMAWHDCRSTSLVAIGRGDGAWRGHAWLLGDRPLLAIGSVEPHYFAGFTGAHKTATIGCASFEDVEANHAGALDPASGPCVLEGNPVFEGHQRMLRVLHQARGPSLAVVNVVQAGRKILAATGGDPLGALRGIRAAAESAFVRRTVQPADALVLRVGPPLGRNFYQADKAIKNNELAVRDGGVIVLVAECEEGIGQDHFLELLRQAPTAAAARQIVADRGYRLGDHKAVRLRALTDPAERGVRVYVVSDVLRGDLVRLLGFTASIGVDVALSEAGIDEDRDTVYRVLDAGNVCVLPENAAT